MLYKAFTIFIPIYFFKPRPSGVLGSCSPDPPLLLFNSIGVCGGGGERWGHRHRL